MGIVRGISKKQSTHTSMTTWIMTIIYEDIMDILGNRMSAAVNEVNKVLDLKDKLKLTNMLSTQYRLRLEFICSKIANKEEVQLDDMIWAEKLAKANTTARVKAS